MLRNCADQLAMSTKSSRSLVELLITVAAVVLGAIGYLSHSAVLEAVGLFLAFMALGMLLVRTLPGDDPPR
jgi:hypothetical protein